MKAYILRILALLFSIIASFQTLAFDDDVCDSLNSDNDFAVYFEIDDAKLLETVWIEKKGGGNEKDIAIWTDNVSVGAPNPVVIRAGAEIETDEDYQIWLTYKSSGLNDKTGIVTYYLLVDGQWQEISSNDADLSTLHSVNIIIDEDNVDDLECSDDIIQPPIPEYSLDAKYEFGTAQCNLTHGASCSIPFMQNYDIAPLVFVMPTIDINSPDEDKPATLYVSSALTASSTSVQISKDTVNILQMDNDVPITEVSYLIIEPGVADFNGHKVIAGYIETAAENSKSDPGSSTEVDYDDFGWEEDLDNPVVLHQIQTRNNDDKWMTSGKQGNRDDSESVRLFLELSASKVDGEYVPEKIGFIATEAVSNHSVGNDNIEFARGFDTPTQNGGDSMTDGCTKGYADVGLERVDGIIGNKQERRGGHGGWTRRCEIKDDNQVSFVIDEDQENRSHLREEVGYFAFEYLATELPQVCEYVPDTLQTNHYANSPPIPWGALQVVGGAENKIFPVTNDPQYSFQTQPPISDLCSYPNGSIDYCTVDTTKTYDTIPMPTPDFTHGEDDVLCDNNETCQLDEGDHKDVIIKENAKLQLTGGEYWLNELKFEEQNAQLEILAPSVIHYKKIKFSKKNIKINVNGVSENLLLIGHGKDSAVELPDLGGDTNFQIYAYFYVDPIATNATNGFVINGDNNAIYGGISAHSIAISGRKNKIYGRSEHNCGTLPTPDVSYIEIKPYNYHLTCELDPDNIVEVHMFNSDDELVSGYDPSLTELGTTALDITLHSNSGGIAKFNVVKKDQSAIGTYDLEARLTQLNSSPIFDDDIIEYVPYRFDIDDVSTFSGQSNDVNISVEGCVNGSVIELGYDGSPEVSYIYEQPTLHADPNLDKLGFAHNLDDPDINAELTFRESGRITVTIQDESYVCDEEDSQCPIEGGVLKGEFEVKSRPWKIAICDVKQKSNDSNLNPSTKVDDDGFMPSKDVFLATYRPIFHPDSAGGVSDLCSGLYPIARNYAFDNGPLDLEYEVSYPIGDSVVEGELTPTTNLSFSTENVNEDSTLTVEHTWNEVGTILLESSANYLEEEILPYELDIGRFYPNHLTLISNSWNYESNHNGFAYMAQEISFSFIVEAQNSNSEPVENYGLFSNALKASVKHVVVDENTAVLNTRIWLSGSPDANDTSWGGGDWSGSRLTVANTDYEFLRLAGEDGPYDDSNSEFGLWVSDKVDGVDLQLLDLENSNDGYTDGTKFTSQPDFRYGRMSLKDVGGNQNSSIQVPLEVQYWSGSQFVVNIDDSGSEFSGSDFCFIQIWGEKDTGAKLTSSADETVSDGASSGLLAEQDTDQREQVRLFLRQGLSPSGVDDCKGSVGTQPWLQYNWRGKTCGEDNNEECGDEDPSTVVTFGIHRGNDRVIFRGETGLTGQ